MEVTYISPDTGTYVHTLVGADWPFYGFSVLPAASTSIRPVIDATTPTMHDSGNVFETIHFTTVITHGSSGSPAELQAAQQSMLLYGLALPRKGSVRFKLENNANVYIEEALVQVTKLDLKGVHQPVSFKIQGYPSETAPPAFT